MPWERALRATFIFIRDDGTIKASPFGRSETVNFRLRLLFEAVETEDTAEGLAHLQSGHNRIHKTMGQQVLG